MKPSVIPMLAYENGVAAMEWLCRVFGFAEEMRMVDENGRLTHGEIELEMGIVMLASPSPLYQSPVHHRQGCAVTDQWNQVPYIFNGVFVYVSNIEAHFQKARALGAHMLSELEYGGPGTRYRVEDLEGQRWMFMQKEGSRI